MKPSVFIKLAVLILSFLISEVYANDSARSTTSQKSTTVKNKTSTVSDHQINKVGTCPKTLVDSLNDDQGTKLLGTYSKIEETCGNFSLNAPGQVVPRMRYSSTPELYKKNLENILSKKVSSQLKYQLEGCNHLPPKTQAALATRLYSASLRFDDFNGQIAEQIAYIDNLVPESATDEYECSELFPSAKNKCPKNFKNICKKKPEDRLNDLAKETSAALVKINNAKKLLESCKSKNFAGAIRLVGEQKQSYFSKKCNAEFQLVQFLESKHTWLTSPEFLKSITVKDSKCSGTGQGRGATGPKICTDPVYKGEKEIKTAIQKQLSDDRKVLIDAHKKSIKDFKCMYSDKVDNSNCNFQDIRKSLVEMGESGRIKLPEATSIEDKTKNIEMEYYLGIEKCSLDAGKYRQTKTDEKADIAKSIAIEGGIIVGTAGLGTIASASRLIFKAGQAARIAQKAVAIGTAVGANAYYGSQSIREVVKECKDKELFDRKAVINTKQDQSAGDYKLKICGDPKSIAVQVKEIDDNCLESALWLAADAAAIGIGAKGFVNLSKGAGLKNLANNKSVISEKLPSQVTSSDKKVSAVVQSEVDKATKDIKNNANPAAVRKTVGQLDVLGDDGAGRLKIANELSKKEIGRELTPDEQKWIIEAHTTHGDINYGQIGSDKVRDKLKAGGGRPESLNSIEGKKLTRALMENGILGQGKTDADGLRLIAERLNANGAAKSEVETAQKLAAQQYLKENKMDLKENVDMSISNSRAYDSLGNRESYVLSQSMMKSGDPNMAPQATLMKEAYLRKEAERFKITDPTELKQYYDEEWNNTLRSLTPSQQVLMTEKVKKLRPDFELDGDLKVIQAKYLAEPKDIPKEIPKEIVTPKPVAPEIQKPVNQPAAVVVQENKFVPNYARSDFDSSDVVYNQRLKHAENFKTWSGGHELNDEQSKFLFHRTKTFSNLPDNPTVAEKMREIGFQDDQIRILQLNNFSVSEKNIYKPLTDSERKTAWNNVDQSGFRTVPENLKPSEAQKMMIEKLRPQKANVDGIRDETLRQIESITQNQRSLTDRIRRANNIDEVRTATESRKAYSVKCKNLWSVFISTKVFLSDGAREDYEKRIKQNCNY